MDVCRRISGVDTSGFGCTITLPPNCLTSPLVTRTSRPHTYNTNSQQYENQYHMMCPYKYALDAYFRTYSTYFVLHLYTKILFFSKFRFHSNGTSCSNFPRSRTDFALPLASFCVSRAPQELRDVKVET